MKFSRRILSRGAIACVFVLLLGGCALFPRPVTSIEQLAGEWVFVDAEGVSSTLVIDNVGLYTVDRAPEEAFRVLWDGPESSDWDRKVNWDRAEQVSGVARIDQLGRVNFSTSDPEWGGSVAYVGTFRNVLEFFVGDPDNQDLISYVRVDEG